MNANFFKRQFKLTYRFIWRWDIPFCVVTRYGLGDHGSISASVEIFVLPQHLDAYRL
jgi:hypothetical protein